MTKICSKCKQELDESCFSKRKDTKDGLSYICKNCKKEYDKIFDEKKRQELNLDNYCLSCGKSIKYEQKINDVWFISKYCKDCFPQQEFKDIICEKCNKIFKVGRKPSKINDYIVRKYCPDCSSMNQDTKELVCPKCGKTYIVTRTPDGRHFRHKRVCDECSKPATEKIIYCECCNKPFVVEKYPGTNSFRKIRFCSTECSNVVKEKKAICQCCGKEFQLERKDNHFIPKQYCSRECRLKVQREKLKAKQEETLNKMIETCRRKYGVDYPCQTKQCMESNPYIISNINIDFANKLEQNNIEFEYEFKLGPYSYDFHILNTNYLIEINPTISHYSLSKNEFEPFEPRDSDFHYKKTAYAKENGYICICVWDWDDQNYIINLLSQKLNIVQCEMKAYYSKNGNTEYILKTEDNDYLLDDGYRLIYTDGFEIIPQHL